MLSIGYLWVVYLIQILKSFENVFKKISWKKREKSSLFIGLRQVVFRVSHIQPINLFMAYLPGFSQLRGTP